MSTPETFGGLGGGNVTLEMDNSSTTTLPVGSFSTGLYTNLMQDSLHASTGEYIFKCKDGMILPCWPSDGTTSTMVIHGIVYLLALIYTFVGVAIIADRFMASIEEITSQETDVIVRKKDGTKEIISVRIWNETVSNLTLMALGSSAPEIMLSVIEIYAQDFQAGDLGPGTIVGSAAFNMFVIIAVCVAAVPTGTIKKIKYLRVFIVTLSFSVFAYVWMLVILKWISPGVIEVWEGLVTFGFFFVTVITAYVADKRLLIYKYLDKHYRVKRKIARSNNDRNSQSQKRAENGTDAERAQLNQTQLPEEPREPGAEAKNLKIIENDDDLKNIEDQREHVIEILKDVRCRHPEASIDEIESLARAEIAKLEPKSRAYYRMIASKRYLGSAGDLSSRYSSNASLYIDSRVQSIDESRAEPEVVTVDILFNPVVYTVMEDVGTVKLTLTRVGDLSSTIVVCYRTEDGTAKAGSDFDPLDGTLIFGPGEVHKQIVVRIINDDDFEDDEHFFVKLYDAAYQAATVDSTERPPIRLREDRARINILDDDHCGIFGFVNNVFQIPETIGEYTVMVNRYCGARGQIAIPYKTIPATAKHGEDFHMAEGELIFNNNETQKEITLQIINNVNYEKNSIFYVELYEPRRIDNIPSMEGGAPKLGDLTKCMIRIRESKDFKQVVDNLMRRRRGLGDRTSSWENQLIDAVKVHKLSSAASLSYDTAGDIELTPRKIADLESSGLEREGEPEGDGKNSIYEYICHYLTLFWKLLFAFVPPPTIWNGWACFIVSISLIGVLTSFINDLASHFGATVHLKDSVTAISLVALGTSVPDTFASKIAAETEKNADSSIGNVTGSNAVNVFLGIGLAWTVAAIYHAFKGTPGGFQVDPGSLGFSVGLFCLCAFVCSTVLMVRRAYCGGELGGTFMAKTVTVMILVGLWIFYLVISTLEAYDVLPGF